MLRTIHAANPSAMTLDGTRTYVVGESRVAIIDPGPASERHLQAIADAVGDAAAVILLTHQHPDHAAGADDLARRLAAEQSGDVPVRVLSAAAGTLAHGTRIETDAGILTAVRTPGHTADHIALHWLDESAIFVGDLMMGGLDTALVAPPEGDLEAYLGSLDRLEALRPRILYPSHGPPFRDAPEAIERYRHHRMARLTKVRQGLKAGLTMEDGLLEHVYGDSVPEGLEGVVLEALQAYVTYLEGGPGPEPASPSE